MFQLTCPGRQCVKNDVLSGLTVALALVPEAVAFAFVAGVDPLVGLYGAFLMGIVTAFLGGRPGMISGATGAMAVVMVSLVSQHGVQYLFAAIILTGILQALAGALRLGKFIRLVPYPVMIGFVNGLAIVIFLAQLQQFQTPGTNGEMEWLSGSAMWTMLALVALTMAVIHFLPKLTSAIPASLAAIVGVSLIAILFNLDARSVQDVLADMTGNPNASIAGGLPSFHIPAIPLNLETLKIIFPYSLVLAGVGLIESLLTLTLIDEITETRGQGNRECVGQGAANVVNGLFGGMGGCAMIGQSLININSGGRGRLSAIVAALALLGFILFASGLIEQIPVAALVGVMFVVVIGTFEWATFRMIGKAPTADVLISILVAAVTVFYDLAIAVIVGVIVSALVFAWEHAKQIKATVHTEPDGAKIYELSGPLFFGSIQAFHDLFTPREDPDDVVIDFYDSRVADHSALEAIDNLAERYQRAGKKLHLKHLSPECRTLLEKAGSLVEVNVLEDPRYHVADDRLA
ncbi:MAG: sodium-independent anion transporter [Gammaproteobacteria bacterium]|nr:MAG: sodium-independent anion transporter [Gammaproteobacteria bacterium]